MKIAKIHLNNMRNDAYFQFHTEFRKFVIRSIPENLGIAPQFEAYYNLYNKVDEAFKKINKSSLTERIGEADKARDEVWSGLVEASSAGLKHFRPEARAAAKKLKIVFDTYGNVARKPLNEETSAIYNILQDLTGKYAPDVAAAGVGEWVAELQTRNRAFDSLVTERYDEAASRCDIVLKQARAELDEAYRVIEERVNALIVVQGAAAHEEFVKTLNAVIAKYVNSGRRHGAGVQNLEPQQTPENDPQTETP